MTDVESGFDFVAVGGVASKDSEPMVWTKVRVGGQTIASGTLSPADARQLALQIMYAADMAIADAALWRFLKDADVEPKDRALALYAQRELRVKYDDWTLGPIDREENGLGL